MKPDTLNLAQFRSRVKTEGFLALYRKLWDRARGSEGAWISLIAWEDLEPLLREKQAGLEADPWIWNRLPLWGAPAAVKDNIDALGFSTTAGCPAYAYYPSEDAPVVARLRTAGAVILGKTNLDQFATGLVGVRSPYGVPPNVYDPAYIPGGSSSGSAAAVASGQVCFSLGTDTAGSGRVPASLQNLYGLKPSPGRISTRGVVPACRSLDCVSVFALNPEDTGALWEALASFDPQDPYGKEYSPLSSARALPRVLRIPLPDQLEWFGESEGPELWEGAVGRWRSLGVAIQPTDFRPFREMARLLYQGPWIAERYATLESFFQKHGSQVFALTHQIIDQGKSVPATEVFRGLWKLEGLKKVIDLVLDEGTAFLTPTIGRPWTLREVAAEPLDRNTDLGYYTNFMNLAGLAALAYPAGFYAGGLPFGVTLFARGGSDEALLRWVGTLDQAEARVPVFVCGAHMEGLALNRELAVRRGTFLAEVSTAPEYRFYALPDGKRPGLVRVGAGGAAIAGELWSLPRTELGDFLAGIPSPLGLGKVRLSGGGEVVGFLCESQGIEGAWDITALGGWREYLKRGR